MKPIILFLVLIISFPLIICSQNNMALQWQKTYGGSNNEYPFCIKQTLDDGFILTGTSSSDDGNITVNHGYWDFWIVKTDQLGNIQWEKSYGGSYEDQGESIRQTTDGGYIIVGFSNSNDGDVTGNHGMEDFWAVKIDQYGNIQWEKSYGGSGMDKGFDVEQTLDGGYIMTGWSNSIDGDVTGNHGYTDYWVVKTDPSGNIQWQKSYGGTSNEYVYHIRETLDGGYILCGMSDSNDGDVTENHGSSDYWIVKIDSTGVIQWQKSYGGSEGDVAEDIQLTNDGGYVISGETISQDGDVTGNHGGASDYWVIKINQSGMIQWKRCYGGFSNDGTSRIQQLVDSSYCIAGYSQSTDGDVTGNHEGSQDYWVVKTDVSGNIEWQSCFGGSNEDLALDIQLLTDSGFLVAGTSASIDGDVTGNHGGYDYWIIKLCFPDPLDISISDTAYCYTTILSATPGFNSYLWNTGDTTQSIVVDTGGMYSVRAINSSGCPSEKTMTFPGPVQPFNGEQICMVTLDSLSGKNVVIIEKTINVGTDSIHVSRMDNLTSLYKVVGSVGINDPGIFTDNDAIPAQQSYQYRISVKDTCGHESGLSAMHKTILLQANTGINHEVNLFWNPYEGFEYSTFEIYRRTVSLGDFILIANVPNTTYAFTDLTPPSGTNLYQVRVSKDTACMPAKSSYGHVNSNVITSSNLGIGENQGIIFTIHPNPAVDKIIIETSAYPSVSQLSIMNLQGQDLRTLQITEQKTQIDISNLPVGIYFVRLTGERSVQTGKFIKQ
jgi:hypothetical protein